MAEVIFKRYADLILTFVLILTIGCEARHKSASSTTKPEFTNEGERANYEIRELFKRDYKIERYDKYKGAIIKNGFAYQYGKITIIADDSPSLIAILDNGLLYPDVITQAFKYERKTGMKVDRSFVLARAKKDTSKKEFFNPSDTLQISAFRKIKFTDGLPAQKRFQFWLFQKPIMNPTEYYIELTNNNATADTDLQSFVKGAKLT